MAHEEIRKAVVKARNFPHNTCGASRHVEQIGEHLITGTPYPMLTEEGPYCGESILSVVASLYKARTQLAEMESLRKDAERYRWLRDGDGISPLYPDRQLMLMAWGHAGGVLCPLGPRERRRFLVECNCASCGAPLHHHPDARLWRRTCCAGTGGSGAVN